MLATLATLIVGAGVSLIEATQVLLFSALWFTGLALLIKGRAAIKAISRMRSELPINVSFFVLDALLVSPVIALIVSVIRNAIAGTPAELISPSSWTSLPTAVTLTTVLFVGDFISFVRHRLEHTATLWPTHAIHHSDVAMTWLTIVRFHPLNRLTTMTIDTACLAAIGFPEWALIANVIVRHFYGEFIHADLPWTYGPLGRVFVSPVMHRWHHARDVKGAGSNFATVFSVFDQLFGTYYVPGLCNVPLGVTDEMGRGMAGQLLFPFVALRRWASNDRRRVKHGPVAPLNLSGL